MDSTWKTRLSAGANTLAWGHSEPIHSVFPPLLPCVVQDHLTGQILMLGYVSQDSINKTVETGNVVFFSRSKKRLWMKGESSGHFLKVVDVFWDCDKDTLLVLADPIGPTCHRGSMTCFDENQDVDMSFKEISPGFSVLGKIVRVIEARASGNDPDSYTHKILSHGIDRTAKKFGEEAVEVVIAAKNAAAGFTENEFLDESADMLFHWLVVCKNLNVDPQRVMEVLEKRQGAPRRPV